MTYENDVRIWSESNGKIYLENTLVNLIYIIESFS